MPANVGKNTSIQEAVADIPCFSRRWNNTQSEEVHVMVKLELTEQQAKTLSEILDTFLSDLRMEIADTERKAWRDKMKEEEDFIKDLIKRLAK
jgi:hypothetical protein